MAEVRRPHSNPLYEPQLPTEKPALASTGALNLSPVPSTDETIVKISETVMKQSYSSQALDGSNHQCFFSTLNRIGDNPRLIGLDSKDLRIRQIFLKVSRYLATNINDLIQKAYENEKGLARATLPGRQNSITIHMSASKQSGDYKVRFGLGIIHVGYEKKIKEVVEFSKQGRVTHIAQKKQLRPPRPESPGLQEESSILDLLQQKKTPHILTLRKQELLRKDGTYKSCYDMDMLAPDLLVYTKFIWERKKRNQVLTLNQEKQFLTYALQIAEGLIGIHEAGICHLDIKLDNILVPDLHNIYIIDFGCSAQIGKIVRRRGSPGYCSPDILFQPETVANPAADVWSLGVLLFILFNGYNPFAEVQMKFLPGTPQNIYDEAKMEFLKILEGVQKDLILKSNLLDSLIAQMLSLNPDARPSMAKIKDELVIFLQKYSV